MNPLTKVRAQSGFGLGLPQWQENRSTAHLDIDGLASSQFAPIDALKCIDEPGTVNFASVNVGMPWELALSLQPGVPLGGGGQLTPGLQVVNVDMTDPAHIFVFGQAYTNAFTPFTFAFNYPVVFEVYGQMGVVDPAVSDGLALSAFCGLHVRPAGVLQGPVGDDEILHVTLSEPPLCMQSPITFYGQQYDELWISANGCVTFETDGGNSIANIQQFQHGVPRVAAFWGDLRPDIGGTISAVAQGGVLTIEWLNVPHATDMELATCAVSFDTNTGATRIENLDLPGPHPETTVIGISPGHSALNSGMTNFDAMVGQGLQFFLGNPNRMLYGAFSSAAPILTGVSAIEFPQSDGTQVEVHAAP